MWVLGLAASHNGAVALVEDGRVCVAIQLERLQRLKRFPLELDASEPTAEVLAAVDYCLRHAGIGIHDVDAVAATTPRPLPGRVCWPGKLHWVPHHLAHAEYVLHYSPLEPGLVLVVDGHGTREADRSRLDVEDRIDGAAEIFEGQTETVSAYAFDGRELALVYRACGDRNDKHALLDDSIGQVWELGAGLCFGARDQAGKLMGLAAYGRRRLPDELMYLDEGGRIRTRLDLLLDPTLPFRDIAHEVQAQTSRVLVELLGRLRGRNGSRVLYYSGGVALNVVANERIIRSGL